MTSLFDVPPSQRVPSDRLAQIVEEARGRTLDLTRDLRGEQLLGPKLSIVNPPLWELGHVGFFNDHFALHVLHSLPNYHFPDAERLYDSSAIAHDRRWDLPLPCLDETLGYLETVRAAMIARLPDGMASEAESYVYQLAVFHEDMHGEAFTYTRQTLGYGPPELQRPASGLAPEPLGSLPGDVHVPGAVHALGSNIDVPFRFDNEKEAHTVFVPAFSIARAPVTNGAFAAFVEDGGYQRPALWSTGGWAWRAERGLDGPVYWRRDSGSGDWEVRCFDAWKPLPGNQPVIHVSWFEAEAWCRWAGRRLPTEAEWEVAASRAPTSDHTALLPGKRRYPWGDDPPDARRANLDGYRLGCVDVAALPDGDSALGCRQMIGNVWEWTASRFTPFPGFRADLYKEYSEPWFAERRRVLRGGSWATRGRMIHAAYRNFFTPERNDVLAGFRTCAL